MSGTSYNTVGTLEAIRVSFQRTDGTHVASEQEVAVRLSGFVAEYGTFVAHNGIFEVS
jgi:hypothetical protein